MFCILATILGAVWLAVSESRTTASAALKVLGVMPQKFTRGDPLSLTLAGDGFDGQTRVALTLDVGNRGAIVGSLESPGTLESVRVVGRYAYLASNYGGLQVVDLNAPQDPLVVGGERELSTAAWDLDIVGDRAYVADVRSGLLIFDLSDPENPVKIGQFSAGPKKSWGIALMSPEVALLAQGKDGVLVLDLSVPAAPRPLSRIQTSGFSWDVTVEGTRAYVADGNGGLGIYDLQEPTGPRLLGRVASRGHVRAAVVESGVAYLAASQRGFETVDVSNPAAPRPLGRVDVGDHVYDVVLSHGRAYLAATYVGLVAVDVSDPGRPEIAGIADTPGSVRGLDLVGNYAVLACGDAGLRVADTRALKPSQAPVRIPTVKTTALARGEDKLFLGESERGLATYRVDAQGQAPVLVSQAPGTYALEAEISGDLVVTAAGDNGLQVYRWDGAEQLVRLSGLPVAGDARRLSLIGQGRAAVVAAGAAGVAVVDLADPGSPVLRAMLDQVGEAVDVAGWDNHAAVIDGDGALHLFDLADLSLPRKLATLELPGRPRTLAVSNQTLYLTGKSDGLYLVDVRQPAAPRVVETLLAGEQGMHVWREGDRLYLIAASSDFQPSLYLFEASDPQRPSLLGRLQLAESGASACSGGGRAYLAGDGLTLRVIDVRAPEAMREIGLFRGQRGFASLLFDRGRLWGFERAIRLFEPGTDGALKPLPLAVENFREILGIFPRGDDLFLLDRFSGLHGFDLGGVGGPRLADSLGFSQSVNAWWAQGDRAYVFDRAGGVSVIDIADPADLRLVTESDLGGTVGGVAMHGETAFLAMGSAGVGIYDFARPEEPRKLGQFSLPWPRGAFAAARDLELAGDLCLVANGEDGLLILDVGDRDRVRPIAHLPIPGYVRRLWVHDDLAFLEQPNEGLIVVDFSKPSQPRRVAAIEATGSVTGLAFADGHLWVAKREGGVITLPMPVLSRNVQLNGETLLKVELPSPPLAGTYTLDVFSGNGAVSLPGILKVE